MGFDDQVELFDTEPTRVQQEAERIKAQRSNLVIEPVDLALMPMDHVRELCQRRYPGHRRGCPNYGKPHRKGCPPQARPIGQILDLSRPVYLVAMRYNLDQHAAAAKSKHPRWTDKQCKNPRHWQGTVASKLRAAARAFAATGTLLMVETPEACGVNVTETCKKIGIELEWPPEHVVWKVVLVGNRVGDGRSG